MSTELVAVDGEVIDNHHVEQRTITPAQAKIDAVANLTMKAYERASTLQLSDEEKTKLQANFPDQCFRSGAGGKESLIYIEHTHLRSRLNEVFGPGQWTLVPRSRWGEDFVTKGSASKPAQKGVKVYVEAMLLIRGCFVGEAIGDMDYYPSNSQTNYGDAVEGAKTSALRRCVKELGVGLQAWDKSWCDGWWARRGSKQPPQQAAQQHTEYQEPPKAIDPLDAWVVKIPSTGTSAGYNAIIDAVKVATPPLTIDQKKWLLAKMESEGKKANIVYDTTTKAFRESPEPAPVPATPAVPAAEASATGAAESDEISFSLLPFAISLLSVASTILMA